MMICTPGGLAAPGFPLFFSATSPIFSNASPFPTPPYHGPPPLSPPLLRIRGKRSAEEPGDPSGHGRRFTLAREGQRPIVLKRKKKRMGEAPAETTRGSRDRLKGQPQERQHSAAEGGTRDRLPPASDSRAASRRVGITLAFMISSQ